MAPSSQPDRGRWSCAPTHRPPDARTRCRNAPRHDLTYACGSMRVHPLTAVALALVLLTCTVAACAAPAASFDPTGTCTADGSAPGAYPDLEALIPSTYQER